VDSISTPCLFRSLVWSLFCPLTSNAIGSTENGCPHPIKSKSNIIRTQSPIEPWTKPSPFWFFFIFNTFLKLFLNLTPKAFYFQN
jgi:hypothetical protein